MHLQYSCTRGGAVSIDKWTDSWGAIVTKELSLLVSKTDLFLYGSHSQGDITGAGT